MNRSSIFKRKIDFNKSEGSYLFDINTKHKYLDFFGQYSTLAIGYNHPIFKTKEYLSELKSIGHQKITNCEILSSESLEFDKIFRDYTSKNLFSHYHYTCTGALAIEAAIKTAMDYKGKGFNRVISFKKSFHGINGYGGIFTDRFGPVNQRLKNFPGDYWDRVDNPVITYKKGKKIINEDLVNKVLNDIELIINKDNNVCAILIEPIQCTYGDYYFPKSFFDGLRDICDKYDIPMIFDEIQVGFAATGKLWYFEHLTIDPDILVFGKKTQLSGIAVKNKFAKIFENSIRLEVTWDSDIIDMVRCKYIIQAYQEGNVLSNVRKMSSVLSDGLEKISELENVRYCGLLFAFDFDSKFRRDSFLNQLIDKRMLCNPTGDKTIRLRPNLFVSIDEIEHSLSIIKAAVDKI